jgi:hypothetical protein
MVKPLSFTGQGSHRDGQSRPTKESGPHAWIARQSIKLEIEQCATREAIAA